MVGIDANHMSQECIATAENSKHLSNLAIYIISGNNTTGNANRLGLFLTWNNFNPSMDK